MGWGDVAYCDAVFKSYHNVFLSFPKDKFCAMLKPFSPLNTHLKQDLLTITANANSA
jgi:hypothetical protein